jgi:RNA polymerase sigma-70 factor, ECF subfamily
METAMGTQVLAGGKMSEESLIRAGQRGEAQALNTLFCRHHKSLFHSALGVMGNPEDAEDALQDGLLAAYRGLKSFEGRAQFSTWLTRIVINAALMRRRGLATRPTTLVAESLGRKGVPISERLVSNSPTPEQVYGRLEILKMIKDRIYDLSPILRSVFVLRIVRGHKAREAARILNVPINTLKARLWRARHQLAARLSRSLLDEVTALSDCEFKKNATLAEPARAKRRRPIEPRGNPSSVEPHMMARKCPPLRSSEESQRMHVPTSTDLVSQKGFTQRKLGKVRISI